MVLKKYHKVFKKPKEMAQMDSRAIRRRQKGLDNKKGQQQAATVRKVKTEA